MSAHGTNEQMNPETLEALRGSIAKWERVVAGEIEGNERSNCPLCARFWENSCFGCPVAASSGVAYCKRTPYKDYVNAFADARDYDRDTKLDPEVVAAAQAELDFLKSLLPPEAVTALDQSNG